MLIYQPTNQPFFGKNREISGNATLSNVAESTIKISDNVNIKTLKATKALLTDNVVIDNFILTTGYRDRYPYSEFKNDYISNRLDYIGYPPDFVAKDNVKIKKISSNRNFNNIKLICEKGIPQIPQNFLEKNQIYYIFGKNINYKQPIKSEYCIVKDFAQIANISSKNTHIKDNAIVENITADELFITDDAFAGNVIAKSLFRIRNNAKCNDVLVMQGEEGANYSSTNVRIGDNVNIKNLTVAKTSKLSLSQNAHVDKAKNITANGIISLHDNSKITNARSAIIELKDNANCTNINASKSAILTGNSTANSINACDFVQLKDNSVVNNICMNSKQKPLVYICDKAKLMQEIKFIGEKGTVVLFKDSTTNTYPQINATQIHNGRIIKDIDFIKEKENEKLKTKQTSTHEPLSASELKGFAKVVGMEELKEELRMDVIEPIKHPEEYAEYKLTPVNGLMLYGPPGCGKTYIANALAEELGRPLIYLDGANVVSRYVGVGVEKINQKFDEAIKKAPSVIFIDEVESIAPERKSLDGSAASIDFSNQVTALLTKLNNISEKNVIVVFATNEPQKIDDAVKRCGRIDKKFYVAPPDYETRLNLLKMYTRERPLDDNINFEFIARCTHNYASSDIKAIVEQAVRNAARHKEKISTCHFDKALIQIRPSLNEAKIMYYKNNGEDIDVNPYD